MHRTSFNEGWEFRPKVNPFAELSGASAPWETVTLPHDAMIGQDRDPAGDPANAYFPGGTWEYRKTFHLPEHLVGKRILLEFEGVYRDATVFINGVYAGQRPYGYSLFRVDAGRFLRPGDNEIRVEARAHKDSRWYTGAGIYRDVWLLDGDLVRIAPDGVVVTTPDIDGERAVVEVATSVVNDSISIHTVDVTTTIRDVTTRTTPLTIPPGETVTLRQRFYVPRPSRWSVDDPNLYTADVWLGELDAETVTFGIRDLRLDPVHGLRINGETVTLRGACVHHDNGILGAATHATAEERRIRLLKAAGFNAIRVSHQPASVAMLDACDRLGMLVIDEAFDMWTSGKTEFDYHLHFEQWWERDLEALVAKDRNHASVIMYSIGNEIPETGSPAGALWGRRLAEKVRDLDSTRYVTNGINNMLAVLDAVMEGRKQRGQDQGGGINTAMADAGAMMNMIGQSEMVTTRTAESYGLLDVAGMNYSESRYAMDAELFPERIILGTETFPTRIDELWALVKQHPHVIGDFTWTGWDYLGEVGIGRPQYLDPDAPRAFAAPYPHLTADAGDIDILGHRRPASFYREIVFGLRTAPYLAVRRPQHHGKTFIGTPWAWSDSINSWTWPGFEGAPIVVEVYADADEVELSVNGQSHGRTTIERFRAEFELGYEPGELVVIAYRSGVEIGRDQLRSASEPTSVRAAAERAVITDGELAYVALTLSDAAGTVHTAADLPVTVDISGGELIGFGSADPSTEQRYDRSTRTTYEGRALLVVRPTGPGDVRVIATAPGCESAEALVTVEKRP
ncbi:beta-galactosidase [Actinoplanes lutulentus]|uniref:Glycosyl hydrolase family 2 n=1 Tax=Actinoplanes lutulentus TaxID=1287878 RepID=A0A327YXM9_9ACTN|nr:glycoside hydrolase family 2 TIM barrel-domain containing protein [Actinoplanes lutulentus]MBB2946523.1 beta-galactosidase [Actinoplanes lutulentus]RAK26441.1 glycosyl hydrolase family 2 [Actinoplanes lutulentus]